MGNYIKVFVLSLCWSLCFDVTWPFRLPWDLKTFWQYSHGYCTPCRCWSTCCIMFDLFGCFLPHSVHIQQLFPSSVGTFAIIDSFRLAITSTFSRSSWKSNNEIRNLIDKLSFICQNIKTKRPTINIFNCTNYFLWF